MKKTDQKILEEIIRVDHAGERGAIKIYEGQLLALSTIKQDKNLKKIIEEMKEHEKEHLEYFEKEIQKRNMKPTYLLPLWDLMGVSLGFGSALLGKIGEDEKDLKTKIEKFKGDEVNHKNIAYESGASRTGIYSIMDKIIRTGSKIAITISEKI